MASVSSPDSQGSTCGIITGTKWYRCLAQEEVIPKWSTQPCGSEGDSQAAVKRGSQTVAYFAHPDGISQLSRFTGEYVRDHHGHEVVQMLGPRGGDPEVVDAAMRQ
mmetsp:Transcript_22385/g.51286  ORF Transcript_22385/g.51286 Transcript_22385/m.51286 type:complete len:106 (-) Transcript_22385:21-338(-)